MADLRRQNQDVWVCSIIDEIEIQDENGDYTGIFRKVISNPIKYRLGVSSDVGNIEFSPIGTDLQYSREICTSKKQLNINEGDLLFIDLEPTLNADGSLTLNDDETDYVTSPDYIVKAKLSTKKSKYVRFGLEKR